MCGIAGAFGTDIPDSDRIQNTLAQLRNRGPNASGIFKGLLRDQHLTLLHTRLSIIDLDPRADQPLKRDHCALIYNGELYNYLELKVQLESAGYQFITSSDTEVVLNSYLHYGNKCFEYFEGMWALALFDKRQQRLILSRDRFGEKPLFYWLHQNTLYFGSEILGKSPNQISSKLRATLSMATALFTSMHLAIFTMWKRCPQLVILL